MIRLPTALRPALLIALVVTLLALATGPMAATASAGGGSGSGKDDTSGKGGSDDDTTTTTTTTTGTTTATTTASPGTTTVGGTTTSAGTTTGAGAATQARSDVRSVGRCTSGVTAWVRVQGDGRTLDVRIELGDVRAKALWHLALVHERHVSWKGSLRSGTNRRIRVRRSLRDYAGSDTVTAHAWGPAGRSCRVTLAVPA